MICVIVLAAGLSTRFGRNKLLEKVGRTTLIERVVRSALKSKADQVVVVVGHEREKIMAALSNFKLNFIFNKDYMHGQSSSVKAGVSSVFDRAEAVVILPADAALVTTRAINAVIDAYRKSKAPIVAASHKGAAGFLKLYARSLLPEVMGIEEERHGMKRVLKKHRREVEMVEVGPSILVDIDTVEDFERHFRLQ